MPYAPRPRDPALQEIVDRIGISELARRIKPAMSKQAVYAWRQVPEDKLSQVAKISGVSKHQLRPDLFARNGRRLNKGR